MKCSLARRGRLHGSPTLLGDKPLLVLQYMGLLQSKESTKNTSLSYDGRARATITYGTGAAAAGCCRRRPRPSKTAAPARRRKRSKLVKDQNNISCRLLSGGDSIRAATSQLSLFYTAGHACHRCLVQHRSDGVWRLQKCP